MLHLYIRKILMKDYKIIEGSYLINEWLLSLGIFNIMSLKPIDIKGRENYFKEDVPKLLEKMKLSYKSINVTRQTHSNNISIIDASNGSINFYDDTDGLITEAKDVLIIKSADCLPLIIYDSKNHRLAAVHSGWKGTANSIVKEAIRKLFDLGSKPEDLSLYVGPHIQKSSFEVMDDVKKIFEDKFHYDDIIERKDETHYLIDLGRVVKMDAMSLGMKEENIYLSSVDTVTDERFQSYRRDKKAYGLMYTLVCLS